MLGIFYQESRKPVEEELLLTHFADGKTEIHS